MTARTSRRAIAAEVRPDVALPHLVHPTRSDSEQTESTLTAPAHSRGTAARAPAERLDAALEAVTEGQLTRVPGVAHDPSGGHEREPWRSILKRGAEGALKLKVKRHRTEAEAALRVLKAHQEHVPSVKAGSYALGQRHTVDAQQLQRLVAAAARGDADAAG